MADLGKIANALKSKYSSVEIASEIEDPKDFVSTGNLAFDLISDGGMPFGYVIEFLGLSQSGKSTLLYQVIANSMKKYDSIGILVDRENAYIKSRGEQLGIKNENLIVVKPKDVPVSTDAFQFILDSISKVRSADEDLYIVVGIDSISAFGKDVELSKSDSGRKAKQVHEGLREVLSIMDDRIMLIVCNQVTYKVGVLYGDPRTTTAGESLKYYGTIRLALEDKRKIVDQKRGNEVIGNWIGVEVLKTRLGPCHRNCFFQHFYDIGIPYYSGYARLLSQRGYLSPKNKREFWAFKQVLLKDKDGREINENEIESYLKEHPELLFSSYPEFVGS